jgi:trimethylamine--corrinoid protein Co-methyltransferase
VDASEDALALDLIEQVGTIPGFYLDKAHTRKWWRGEQYIPMAAELSNIQTWRDKGKKNSIDLAKEKMADILSTYKNRCALTPSQEQDIDRIIKDARAFYKKRIN